MKVRAALVVALLVAQLVAIGGTTSFGGDRAWAWALVHEASFVQLVVTLDGRALPIDEVLARYGLAVYSLRPGSDVLRELQDVGALREQVQRVECALPGTRRATATFSIERNGRAAERVALSCE